VDIQLGRMKEHPFREGDHPPPVAKGEGSARRGRLGPAVRRASAQRVIQGVCRTRSRSASSRRSCSPEIPSGWTTTAARSRMRQKQEQGSSGIEWGRTNDPLSVARLADVRDPGTARGRTRGPVGRLALTSAIGCPSFDLACVRSIACAFTVPARQSRPRRTLAEPQAGSAVDPLASYAAVQASTTFRSQWWFFAAASRSLSAQEARRWPCPRPWCSPRSPSTRPRGAFVRPAAYDLPAAHRRQRRVPAEHEATPAPPPHRSTLLRCHGHQNPPRGEMAELSETIPGKGASPPPDRQGASAQDRIRRNAGLRAPVRAGRQGRRWQSSLPFLQGLRTQFHHGPHGLRALRRPQLRHLRRPCSGSPAMRREDFHRAVDGASAGRAATFAGPNTVWP